MTVLDGLIRIVDVFVKALSIGVAAVLAGLMVVQVFFRYVLNDSLRWSEELSVYLLVWMIFLGAAVVAKDWQHTSITFLRRALPRWGKIGLTFFAKGASLVFFVVLADVGTEVFNARFHGKSLTMGFSTKWAKLAIPASAAVMCLYILNSVLRDSLHLWRRDYDHFEETDEALVD